MKVNGVCFLCPHWTLALSGLLMDISLRIQGGEGTTEQCKGLSWRRVSGAFDEDCANGALLQRTRGQKAFPLLGSLNHS